MARISDESAQAAAPAEAAQQERHRLRLGILSGAVMAVGAAASFAVARAGIVGGLSPADLIAARFLAAGLIMLPFLLAWGLPTLAGIGWRRGLVLVATGGPLFAILQTGGYAYAPLAHGAVIAPSVVTILSTIAAALFLRERLSQAHVVGAAIVLAGIAAISWHGLSAGGHMTWLGDLLFAVSSVLWSVFTVLMRHWRIDAARATAVVCVLSMVVVLPAYAAWAGSAHFAALPLPAMALQALVQGGLQSVVTLIAYTQAVALLGVSRAVLFPALVPAISVLIGIPVAQEIPSPLQLAGLATVTLGLLVCVGAAGRALRFLDRRTRPIA